jgi:predicted transcriptional regulator
MKGATARRGNEMPVQMTDEEDKVWKYLVQRKNPVTQKQLMKYFCRSGSYVSKVLRKFMDAGILDVIQVGTQKFYKLKD